MTIVYQTRRLKGRTLTLLSEPAASGGPLKASWSVLAELDSGNKIKVDCRSLQSAMNLFSGLNSVFFKSNH